MTLGGVLSNALGGRAMSGNLRLAPGAVFAGEYRIVRRLGSGGMGSVYVVDQVSTGKQRALKLMHPDLVESPAFRARFEREATIGAQIDSDHIVEVHAAGIDTSTGVPWLVMELLRGQDLAQRVKAAGPLSRDEARAIFEQLCHGVAAAHDAGVVHRDLKPENVFIATARRAGDDLLVKVLDFGIAQLSAETAKNNSTEPLGSPRWMAPEQTTRDPLTPGADVWAIALMLYHAMTGASFWNAAKEGAIAELLREILIDPIPRASERAAARGHALDLGPEFDEWFSRCLSRAPDRRFADAREAWAALLPILTTPTEAARTRWVASLTDTVPQPPPAARQVTERMYGPGQTVIPLVPFRPEAAKTKTHAMAAAPSTEPASMTTIAVALGGALCGISLIVAVIDGLSRSPTPEPPAAALSQLPSDPPTESALAPELLAPVVFQAPPPVTAAPATAAPATAAPTSEERPQPTALPAPRDARMAALEQGIANGDWALVKALLLPRKDSLSCADLAVLKMACRATADSCAKQAGDLRVARQCP